MAWLLPQASKGPFEERALAGQGQPSIACPQAASKLELFFSTGTVAGKRASLPMRGGCKGIGLGS